jgi:hypothetical protein
VADYKDMVVELEPLNTFVFAMPLLGRYPNNFLRI